MSKTEEDIGCDNLLSSTNGATAAPAESSSLHSSVVPLDQDNNNNNNNSYTSPIIPSDNNIPQRKNTAELQREDAQNRLLFVFPELKEALEQRQQDEPLVLNSTINNFTTMDRHTGVLWKRRDVFKNRWRPRWFTLNPHQGVLTYYLLSSPTSTVPSRVPAPPPEEAVTPPRGSSFASRNRATSWDSAVSGVSENTVDYDVVPRGTIYLLGCTVMINENLSRPNESLYAFTIRPPSSSESYIHLAARTEDARAVWVRKLDRVCRVGSHTQHHSNNDNNDIHDQVPRLLTAQRLVHREHSIPEHDNEDELSDEDDRQEGGWRSLWRSLGLENMLLIDVADDLADKIRENKNKYLPMIDDDGGNDNENDDGWKLLFDNNNNNGHKAYRKTFNNGRSMVKSVATLNHPPKQVFSLLIDITRRKNFETNVRTNERMKKLSSHTFLDYYAYNAVWPTSAREFTVVTHWEVVGKGDNDRALMMLSFSCREADELRPVAPKHVRANLFVSMYLIQSTHHHHDQCILTRLLSFDLGGGVSQHLSNAIITQQASLPAIIAEYLQRNEPVVENRYRGLLTNETVESTVIDRLERMRSNGTPATTLGQQSTHSNQSDELSILEDDDSAPDTALDSAPSHSCLRQQQPKTPSIPALELQAVVLFAPVLLYYVTSWVGFHFASLLFFISVYLSVRQIVLFYLGENLSTSNNESLVGPVTCRFSIDLKGVLRFIANKREEKEELQGGITEVSVVHIVASALARALRKEPLLQYKRIRIPWLFIDVVVESFDGPIDVSVSENGGDVVTLRNVDKANVQEIADELNAGEESTEKTEKLGQCLVYSMSNFNDSNMVIDAPPAHPDIAVVAVVGGVYLEHGQKVGFNGFKPSRPRPVLSISLSIRGANQADLMTCRRYAEEVHKLLHFPEMCDG